ncbi:sensor histidine kinase [Aquimarina rubra]|uniref:Sensor histidine kinase n=1 Tax=Aquimarina rubra TaxID=1920033 RepID=A0ABW5L987_9FLAO
MGIQSTTLQRWIEILLNVIFWAISIAMILLTTETGMVENIVEDINGNVIEETIEMSLFILPNLIGMLGIIPLFYYTTFYLVPKYYASKKYPSFVGLFVAGLACLTGLELLIVYFQKAPFSPLVLRFFLFYNLFFMTIAIIYGIVRHQFSMERQQQLLEKEKVKAELRLMQSQINPHFMFNALNNLLAISERSNNPETSSGITKLSNLLRFMIYDTQSEQVLLSKEIEFIENFISLQKLKYSTEDPFDITFTVDTKNENPKIAPTLLIPFVENAFKHGLNIQSASFIDIQLTLKNQQLLFKVKNSKHQIQKTEFDKKYSGIGLENVKKRLKLIYPHQHHLDITEDDHTFYIQLTINLSE